MDPRTLSLGHLKSTTTKYLTRIYFWTVYNCIHTASFEQQAGNLVRDCLRRLQVILPSLPPPPRRRPRHVPSKRMPSFTVYCPNIQGVSEDVESAFYEI
ncbi:hypothetical protein M413DRAFT_143791 [Hebeloma cylindrosporum]|uniref:Uncharacterized protein n=1 Tax=Hebeloma cylindrosporum TaxID=76867 RepID=A0A0C3BZP4_HEBCY|nr:hypothetical protein M413DRAFT_143791 [Hebeloma cylindrosporum h7]